MTRKKQDQKQKEVRKKRYLFDILVNCLIFGGIGLLLIGFRYHRFIPETRYGTETLSPASTAWLTELITSAVNRSSQLPAATIPDELKQNPLMLLSFYNRGHSTRRHVVKYPFSSPAQVREVLSVIGEASSPATIRIDLQASKQKRIWFTNVLSWFWTYDPGKTAIRWTAGDHEDYLFPGQPVEEGVSPGDTWLHYSPRWKNGDVKLCRFVTDSFLYEIGSEYLFPLDRGEPPPPELNHSNVLAAIVDAADYLVRQTTHSGRFVYEYDPVANTESNQYNALRHAGTTFALFQVYGLTGEERFRVAGDRALHYLDRLTSVKDDMRFIVENNYAKLGGAALATLALCEREKHVGDGRDMRKILAFARFMERCQREDGDFVRFDPYHPKRDAPLEKSIYYPGEATFALTRLAALTGDQRWLNVAMKGACALTVRWKFLGIDWYVPFDAWLLYAVSELYTQTNQQWLLDYGHTIARRMVLYQFRKGENRNHDFIGGAYNPRFPQATPTGARAEGLGAFCAMLKEKEQPYDYYLAALKDSGRFQLRQPFRPLNSYYLPFPERARGGFRKSMVEPVLRIDFSQHNISSLLYLLEWIEQ